MVDNLNAVYMAVEHLIGRRHRRIGLIAGPQTISTARERTVGYRRVLADYRLVKGSRSSDKRNAAKNRWLIYRRVEKLSIWKSAAVFAVYACHALRKHRRAR